MMLSFMHEMMVQVAARLPKPDKPPPPTTWKEKLTDRIVPVLLWLDLLLPAVALTAGVIVLGWVLGIMFN